MKRETFDFEQSPSLDYIRPVTHEQEENDSSSIIPSFSDEPDQNQSPTFVQTKFVKVQSHQLTEEKQQREGMKTIKNQNDEILDKKTTIETGIESVSSNSVLKLKKMKEEEEPDILFENRKSDSFDEEEDKSDNDESENKSEELSFYEEEEKVEEKKTKNTSKMMKKRFRADNLEELVLSSVPKSCALNCAIVCREQFFSMTTTYDMFLIQDKKKVLTVTKDKIQFKSYYQIKNPADSKVLANIQSNFTGTEFILTYGNRQICWIGYETNILGLQPQRMMTVIRNQKKVLQSVPHFSQIKTYYENGRFQKLKRYESRRGERKGGKYEINFHGKVKKQSMRNFILEDERAEECMLFGKQDEGVYIMEIKNPFSILEGLAIAISNIDRKMLVR